MVATKPILEAPEKRAINQDTFQKSHPLHSDRRRESNMISHMSDDNPMQDTVQWGRVAIFIDGSNLFYAALQLGVEIDYTKLLCCPIGGDRLLRAFFYTGVDRINEKQQGFLLWMRRNGYRG